MEALAAKGANCSPLLVSLFYGLKYTDLYYPASAYSSYASLLGYATDHIERSSVGPSLVRNERLREL